METWLSTDQIKEEEKKQQKKNTSNHLPSLEAKLVAKKKQNKNE